MQSVNLFELASQQAKWVAVRQKAVANNIANINTPAYKPVEVTPFKEVLHRSANVLQITDDNHMSGRFGGSEYRAVERETAFGEEAKVSLQDELVSAGDVRKTYNLNTAIVKSFHRMILMTVRG